MKKAVNDLKETLKILEKYENQAPPVPEEGCFYSTLNGSIVYVCGEVNDEMNVIILTGGWNNYECGDSYWITKNGYHNNEEPGAHLTMALREKLDLKLPEID